MKRLFAFVLLFASPLAAQVRVNCGGPAYTDSSGNVWQADNSFSGGAVWANSASIAGTPDPTLFKTVRYTNFTYTFAVPNGNYTVNLYFADASTGRVFTLNINGVAVLTNFDVSAKVGVNTADIESFPVTVTNGSITLGDTNTNQDAILNAIDIELAGPPPPFVWVMPGLGTATFPMQIPPACGPNDGTCSIQIQVCDTSQTPPVCMTAPIGTLSLIKTISLPTPQVQTIPVVVVTNP
jgi:hypothetical protein